MLCRVHFKQNKPVSFCTVDSLCKLENNPLSDTFIYFALHRKQNMPVQKLFNDSSIVAMSKTQTMLN